MKVKLSDIKLPKLLMRTVVNQEGIESLSASIKSHGLINPISVRKMGKSHELVAGFRRLTACKALGMKEVEVTIIDSTPFGLEAVKVAENIEREEVNAVDEGHYFAGLIKKKGLTQKALARRIGRSEGYISQRLSVIEWPDELAQYVQSGVIGFSVARELAQIKDIDDMARLVHAAIDGGCTPALAKRWKDEANRPTANEVPPQSGGGEAAGPGATYDGGLMCQTCGDDEKGGDRVAITICGVCSDFIHNAKKAAVFSKNRIEAGVPPA